MSLLAGMDLATVDVDKLGKLLDLQKDWEARDASKQFNAALAAFQSEMPTVFKGRKETTGKYSYAAYEDIMRKARPVLMKHGLAVSFSQEEDDTRLTVICKVSHVGGHSSTTPFTLPKDGPIKTREGRNITSEAQAQGSANSYAKRYCLCNALDIVVSGEDDDATAAGITYIDGEQVNEIERLIEQAMTKTDDLTVRDKMLEWIGAASVAEIPVARFAVVVKTLKRKLV